MKIQLSAYCVREGAKVKLRKRPTREPPLYKSKHHYRKLLHEHVGRLSDLQQIHYAAQRYALLINFQAMDAGGKDGAIRHVMSGVNPQGCQVFSFKEPSAEELKHDFLWRAALVLPQRGHIGIFNRSYYEEVLIARVHPQTLRSEGLDKTAAAHVWKGRYRSIVDFEQHLHRNGTRIIKFFLHISKDEQRRRFLARLDEPQKNWKFSMADVTERSYWKDYMRAYEECLSATSTEVAPWYIIPADDKENARLILSQVILETMGALGSTYPPGDAARRRELRAVRRKLLR